MKVGIGFLAITHGVHADVPTSRSRTSLVYPSHFQGKVFMGVRRASLTRYFCQCTFQFFEWWGLGRGRAARPALGHKVPCFVRLFFKVENNILTETQEKSHYQLLAQREQHPRLQRGRYNTPARSTSI